MINKNTDEIVKSAKNLKDIKEKAWDQSKFRRTDKKDWPTTLEPPEPSVIDESKMVNCDQLTRIWSKSEGNGTLEDEESKKIKDRTKGIKRKTWRLVESIG